MTQGDYNKFTSQIVAAAKVVHKELGPGLLESVYETCLLDELNRRNILTANQVKIPITYKGKNLVC
jgi:GxxExxY protein